MLPDFPRHWKLDAFGRAIMLVGVFALAVGTFLTLAQGGPWPFTGFLACLTVEMGYRTWRHW
jgi:hypothetical protein